MKNQFKAIVLLITFLFISYSSFGFNNQYIKISSLINDTGNMNEGNAITRRFESRFTVNLGTSTPAIFKVPATDAGTAQKIYVEAYISWRNNNTYERVFSSSYTPVSKLSNGTETVLQSKTFSFSKQNPTSWSNPISLKIIASFQYQQNSSSGSFSGPGDVVTQSVPTPPALADVSLGSGSTAYEGLTSFDGSLGEIDILTGQVKILFTTLVGIYQNPLGGSYDPTPEGVGVWVDTSGGTNPTTKIYGATQLAGAYWVNAGIRPSLPFNLPFNGEWTLDSNTPGVVVGGVALAWGAVPALGSNTTWGAQNRHVWFLPPKSISFSSTTPEHPTGNPQKKTYMVFDDCPFTAHATIQLRKLQTNERVLGYLWNYGDNTSTTLVDSKSITSTKTHLYSLANKLATATYHARCGVKYKNSDSRETQLDFPYDVIVKPLPRVWVPNAISITYQGQNVSFPGEDIQNTYQGIGNVSRVCQEGKQYDYSIYFKFDGVKVEAGRNQPISYKFSTLGTKNIKMFLRYKKAQIVGGALVNIGGGYTEELLAERNVDVESQQIMEGETEQQITFKVKSQNLDDNDYVLNLELTPSKQTVKETFTAEAKIFYAHRDENETQQDLDQKSGVRPGSVEYRWKIIDPDGNDAYESGKVSVDKPELLSYKVLPGTSKSISPLTIEFNTPFGNTKTPNRYYKVFIEAKYKELSYKPIYSSGSLISGWQDTLSYKNNSLIRYIEFNKNDTNSSNSDFETYSETRLQAPLNKEGAGNNRDLLFDGSLQLAVKVSDKIPGKTTLSGPIFGTTGDPLQSPRINVIVSDNNPDAIVEQTIIIYKAFNEDTYRMSNENQSYINSNFNSTSFTKQLPTSTFRELFKHNASFLITNPENNIEKSNIFLYANQLGLPNSFATTMDAPGNTEIQDELGKFYYTSRTYIDDGQKYYIESAPSTITITDNDAPEISVTILNSNGTTRKYSVQGGFNDTSETNPAKITLTIKNPDEIYNLEKADILSEPVVFPDEYAVKIPVYQRFLYNLEVKDNVKQSVNVTIQEEGVSDRKITLPLAEKDGALYKAHSTNEIYYNKTTEVIYLNISTQDNAGNKRNIRIPMKISPEDAPDIKIIRQENKFDE